MIPHFLDNWLTGCQPYAPAALYQQNDLLILISIRGYVNPTAIMRLDELGKLKKI
jgi:hypothetical protein